MRRKFFRLLRKNKSQAAFEFLSTYAWAFIAISVTLGALYSFGFLDFGKYLPQTCSFPEQLKCLDFSLTASQINLKLLNNLGDDITVVSIVPTTEDTNPLTCTTPSTFLWSKGTETNIVFLGCSGGSYLRGGRVEVKLTMVYYAQNTPSRPYHTVRGKINARVT